MKHLFKAACFLLLSSGSAPVWAELEVRDAYVRGLPPGVSNTSAYMTLVNTGSQPMELTGASSPIAASVMLHNTVSHDDMLHMEHMAKATIEPGAELVLQSGGLHLMLMKLNTHPRPGDAVALTLEFADGSTRQLRLPVRSVLDE